MLFSSGFDVVNNLLQTLVLRDGVSCGLFCNSSVGDTVFVFISNSALLGNVVERCAVEITIIYSKS